mmetsp:Transcript_123282/g.237693  ORF Transcript_123282/g.237693 Transcript_123282/m.237693 type:complete len:1132 (-) Transcript_123282:117-3512(-)
MADNWGRIFSRESSRDYRPLPTQEPPPPGSLYTRLSHQENPRSSQRDASASLSRLSHQGNLRSSFQGASPNISRQSHHEPTESMRQVSHYQPRRSAFEGFQDLTGASFRQSCIQQPSSSLYKRLSVGLGRRSVDAGNIRRLVGHEASFAPTRSTVHIGAFDQVETVTDPVVEKVLTSTLTLGPLEVEDTSVLPTGATSVQFEKPEEEEEVNLNPASCWRFVETQWFQAISAVVIISNVITTIVELDKPRTYRMFFFSDQMMLGFYVLELCSRANYFGYIFLFGPPTLVCWNVLDIIVVVAGVLDQWLMPLLPVGKHSVYVSNALKCLRLLRLLRVFKIVRIFLDIDLSWTEAPAFQSFIGVVIVINAMLMGMEIDIPWHGWFYFESFLLCIYVFELGVRLKNFGKHFFSCDNPDIVWNVLDFVIVTSSVLDSWVTPLCRLIMKSIAMSDKQVGTQKPMSFGKVMLLMRMLRLMRILRLAKLVKAVRPLFILVTGVLAALQGVVWVLVLTMITLYAMGILATSLIGHRLAFPPDSEVPEEVLRPFNTVPNSMFTLFRVMSGAASDHEQVAIDDLMDNVPSIKLGFVFFMITSSWTLLSILTAVVSDNMISTTSQQEEEHKIQTAEEDRFDHVRRLKALFHVIDHTGDGQVEQCDLEAFLSDRKNALLTAKQCRVPVRDVREVLQTVAEACDGTTVSLTTFVEYLADVSNHVSEKSVMKLEAKLSNLSKLQAEAFVELHDIMTTLHDKSQNNVDQMESAIASCSKVLQTEAREVFNGQLKEVEKLMKGLAGRVEACLSEMQGKSQGPSQGMTEALEQVLSKFGVDKFSEMLQVQLGKMQHELLCSMESDGCSQAMKTENAQQRVAVNENQTNVAETAKALGTQKELSVAQIEELVHALQQRTESMLEKNEGLLEKVSKAVDQNSSPLTVEKFSETVEFELRMMRQELFFWLRQRSPDISKARDAREGDKQSVLVDESHMHLADTAMAAAVPMEVPAAPMEACVLAAEESINGLQGKAEAAPRKVEVRPESADDRRPSAPAVEDFTETLQAALRLTKQELSSCLDRLGPQLEHLMRLEQKTEATLTKVKCLLKHPVDQEISAPGADRFSETLERELRNMRQDLLCSLGGGPHLE